MKQRAEIMEQGERGKTVIRYSLFDADRKKDTGCWIKPVTCYSLLVAD